MPRRSKSCSRRCSLHSNPELAARLRARFPDGTFDLLATPGQGEHYSVGEYIDRALLPGPHKNLNPDRAFNVRTWFEGPDTNDGRLAKTPLVRLELRRFGDCASGRYGHHPPYLRRSEEESRRPVRADHVGHSGDGPVRAARRQRAGALPRRQAPASRPRHTGTASWPASAWAPGRQVSGASPGPVSNTTSGDPAGRTGRGWQRAEVPHLLHIPLFDALAPGEFAAVDALATEARRQGFDVVVWLNTATDEAEYNRLFAEMEPDTEWAGRVQDWARARQLTVAGFHDVFGRAAPPERLADAIAEEFAASTGSGTRGREGLLAGAEMLHRFGGVMVMPGTRLTTGRSLADIVTGTVDWHSRGLVLADGGGGERSAQVMGAVAGSRRNHGFAGCAAPQLCRAAQGARRTRPHPGRAGPHRGSAGTRQPGGAGAAGPGPRPERPGRGRPRACTDSGPTVPGCQPSGGRSRSSTSRPSGFRGPCRTPARSAVLPPGFTVQQGIPMAAPGWSPATCRS